MHVRVEGASWTTSFFEYAHRDHLGSIEVVTSETGNVLDQLAFEPFGTRKAKDWTSNASSAEIGALLARSARMHRWCGASRTTSTWTAPGSST